MISDNLMLNDDKTEFLITGTRQQLAKVNINCIRVGSTDVCPVAVARNLGSWFDEQLTICLLYTSPSPRDGLLSRMPSSA